jgi:hypothetical protein
MPHILPFTNSVFSYRADSPIDATLISKFSTEKGVVLPYDEDTAVADDFEAGDDSDEETGIIDDGESFVKGETTNMGGGDV